VTSISTQIIIIRNTNNMIWETLSLDSEILCFSLAFVSWICPCCHSCGPSTSQYRSSDTSYRNKRTVLLSPHHHHPQRTKERNCIRHCGIELFQEDSPCRPYQNSIACPVVHRSQASSMETYERNYCDSKIQRDRSHLSSVYCICVTCIHA
jgi:hypothetical protein